MVILECGDGGAGKQFVTPTDNMKRAILSIREELGQRIAEFEKQGKLLEAQRIKMRTKKPVKKRLTPIRSLRPIGLSSERDVRSENEAKQVKARCSKRPVVASGPKRPSQRFIVFATSNAAPSVNLFCWYRKIQGVDPDFAPQATPHDPRTTLENPSANASEEVLNAPSKIKKR